MDRTDILGNMQKLFLEALRHREQEIMRYLAILGPALGGFVWLLYYGATDMRAFTIGTMSVLLLLLLGSIYSLALGYNYRYITFELAKIETAMGIRDTMLVGWPRSPKDFVERYQTRCGIPWCTPPEIIKVFWWAFVVGIVWVTITASAWMYSKEPPLVCFVMFLGGFCFLIALLLPIWFGYKLLKKCNEEKVPWEVLPEKNK